MKISKQNKIEALRVLWFWAFHVSEGHEKGELSDTYAIEIDDGRLTEKDAFQRQEALRREMIKISKRVIKLQEPKK